MPSNDERILTAAERAQIAVDCVAVREHRLMWIDIDDIEVVERLLVDGDAAREAIRALRLLVQEVLGDGPYDGGVIADHVNEVMAQTARWVE